MIMCSFCRAPWSSCACRWGGAHNVPWERVIADERWPSLCRDSASGKVYSVSLNTPEPPPQPSTGDVWQLVIADMHERRETGIRKYGTPLQPGNGRDSLVDAYQEALDLAVYLRQAIEEREQ